MLEFFVKHFVLGAEKRDEKGATATEYGLLVAFIAFLIIVGVTAFGNALNDWFNELANAVDGWNV